MSSKLLLWIVSPAPTGRFRSFEHRAWPTAYYRGFGAKDERIAALLRCGDPYSPGSVRAGDHGPISVAIAGYRLNGNWDWRTLKTRFTTLDEAKAAAEEFLVAHPEFQPGRPA